jgi:putative phage-type endonuclease
MKIIEGDQRSETWLQLKAGRPSASEFGKILTPTGKASTQAEKYMYQLAGERVIKTKVETYQSKAMEEGIEKEDTARQYFSMLNDIEVKQVAICEHDSGLFICSPDGIWECSGLEIKCPLIHTHVQYLLEGKLPTEYIGQVQGSMLVTGYQTWNFMSYFPGLDPLIIEVKRDEEYCDKLYEALYVFCKELEKVTERLINR